MAKKRMGLSKRMLAMFMSVALATPFTIPAAVYANGEDEAIANAYVAAPLTVGG